MCFPRMFGIYLLYTVSQKNDTDVAHYNFNARQPVVIFFWQRRCRESKLSNDDF